MLNYGFVLIILTALFIAFSFVLMPFAWLKTVYAKFKLARIGSVPPYEPLLYFIYGLPLLVILIVPDTIDFMRWSTSM